MPMFSQGVAPRVGAWIETVSWLIRWRSVMSHPVWVRGLKHQTPRPLELASKSHPVWVRGLKHCKSYL